MPEPLTLRSRIREALSWQEIDDAEDLDRILSAVAAHVEACEVVGTELRCAGMLTNLVLESDRSAEDWGAWKPYRLVRASDVTK